MKESISRFFRNGSLSGLLLIFLISLFVALLGISVPQLKGEIGSEDATALILRILSIYGVHLAIIVGALFAQESRGGEPGGIPTYLWWPALGLVILWNGLTLYGILAFNFVEPTEGTYEDLVAYLEAVPRESVFLVAGVVAFFAKKAGTHAG